MIEPTLTSLSDALERDGYLVHFFNHEVVHALALEVRLSDLLRALLHGQGPAFCNTVTLMKGSDQPMHIDSFLMTDRPPQSVRARPERFDEAHPCPEKTYLRRYLDVRAAVAERRIPSAFAHYREHGFTEGRGI